MPNLIFLISEAQRNFRKKLFDSVEAQRNSAIAERHFRTKLKRNLTSAIEISQPKANTRFFAILDKKRANNLQKKVDIYQYSDRSGTKLSSMYKIALLTKKIVEAQRNSSATNFKTLVRYATSAMFKNKKLKRSTTSAIAEVAEVALCASNCALPTLVPCVGGS